MQKKKRITGSLQHKPDRPYWYMVFSYLDDAGKRKQKWESTGITYPGNKRAANEALRQRLDELNRRTGTTINMDMTVAELVDVWLDTIEVKVRANTKERYVLNATKIRDYFTEHPVKVIDMTRADARIFFDFLLKEGKKNQKTGAREPMAASSVRDIKVVLGMILDHGVDCGIISLNPVQGVRLTTLSTEADKVKYMDKYTATRFIKYCCAQEDELTDLIVATISFGLRRSEVLGLRYEDIDILGKCIYIRNTITKTIETHAEQKTKNKYSKRQIPISDGEAAFFENIIEKNKKNKQYYGNTYVDTEYLFVWPDGRPYKPDYISKHTRQLLKAFGEPDLHFHSLRHTYASILYEQKVDQLTVQQLIGHAPGSSVTQEVYTHIDRRAAEPHSVGIIWKEK